MPVQKCIPSRVRLFGAGAPPEIYIATPCVQISSNVTAVSFDGDLATTYLGGSGCGGTGPAWRLSYGLHKTVTVGDCMGERVWVKLKDELGVFCRIESAPEALARADAAITLLEARLELAEVKRELAEQRTAHNTK